MNSPERTDSKEKRSSRRPSLHTPPDSAEELSLSPSPSPSSPPLLSSSTCSSLPQSVQSAIQIIKSTKRGYRPDNPWIKLRLGPGDFLQLKERLKFEDDLWGYVQDKIRYDYDPQTCSFIFRMPTGTHDIFTGQVILEIESQLRFMREDTSKPNVAALAKSIKWCSTTDIELQSDPDQDYPTRSPDASFQRKGAGYPSLIIETSFSQKKKDLPRLADDYIIGSSGNIELVVGLDIEYRRSKRATVSMWKSENGFGQDGVPYLSVKKAVDDEPFRNDDSSTVISGTALVIPLSVFTLPGDAPLPPSPDAEISIPYATLHSFLTSAELSQQEMKGEDRSGFVKQLLPGTRLKKRQMTPEEQLEDDDEAQFVASEEKAERKAYEEDSTWGYKKARR